MKNYRRTLTHYIENHLPKPTSSYAAALVLGDRTTFSEASYRDFQELGVVHLLAISGLHIQLLLRACYSLLIRFQLPHEYARITLSVLIPFYIFLTGAGASVVRAGIMAFFSYLLPLFAAKSRPFTSLCLSGIISLALRPFQLMEVGFQLSYTLTAGIILSNHAILRRIKSPLQQVFALSFLTTLLAIPISCYHFYQFSWTGLFLNLLYVPLFTYFVLPLSILSVIFPFIAVICNPLLIVMEKITAQLSAIPFQVFITGRPTLPILIGICLFVWGFFILWEKQYKQRWWFILSILALLFLTKYNWTGKVSFIDIGQGDSILIQLPHNQGNYLIDTGGQIAFQQEKWQKRRQPFSVGSDVLVPVLKAKGIGKLDKVILTHSDADHIGALKELAAEITIGELYHGKGAEEKSLLKQTLRHIAPAKVKVLEAGMAWTAAPNISFSCLYPNYRGKGENNDSLVIKAEMDQKTWLFTGDLEVEGEQKLLSQAIQADVLKVGHHGSKTSTSLLFAEKVQPKIAIISCGVDNRFGHPHQATLQTLKQIGATVYRTDERGEISYQFGKGFTFQLNKNLSSK